MSLSFNATVEVIYRYIVQGISVNIIDEQMDLKNGTASQTICACGFNKIKSEGWKKGQHNGMYRPGNKACRGIRVDRNIIADYLDDIEGWEYDFEWYIAELAKDMEQEREQQKAAEESRRRQEEMRRQHEAQAAAAIEEAKRLRALEEQNRRIAEQNAARDYQRYIELGKSALSKNQTQEAYNNFVKAREISKTVETSYYMAKVLAESGNASEHASFIIELMREYRSYLESNNKTFNVQEHLWYAEASLAAGFRADACDHFYLAGDYYYNQKNYAKAAEIYFDANRRTNYWSGASVDAPFRMAYALSQKSNLSENDIQTCISWYKTAVQNHKNVEYSLGNISYMYYLAGQYDDAVKAAERAIGLGLKERYVYSNLLLALVNNEQYDDALKTMETMDSMGYAYNIKFKADALYFSANHEDSEAVPYYRMHLEREPYDEESIFNYLLCSGKTDSVICALKYLESGKKGSLFTNIAGMACIKAEMLGDESIYLRSLQFCPDKKAEYLKAKEQERLTAELQLKREMERRRAEEEKKRAEEDEKQRLAKLKDQKKADEEILLLF